MYLIMYMINAYDNQIVQNNPSFNLSKSSNNSFDNQGSKINKTEFFLRVDILPFTKTLTAVCT